MKQIDLTLLAMAAYEAMKKEVAQDDAGSKEEKTQKAQS